MRLIDADALLKHEIEADRMGAMLVVGKGYILSAPEVDAVPVVRGEWIKVDQVYVKCSHCDKHYYNLAREYGYCPTCGARMIGGEDNERN